MASTKTLVSQIRGGVEWNGDQGKLCCPFHDDKNPSCSVNVKDNVFNCFGCSEKGTIWQLLDRAGITYQRDSDNGNTPYDYVDAVGVLRYQSVRTPKPGGKDFFLRQPNGSGWFNKMTGVSPLLFNLPAVVKAIAKDETVVFCEGEKDVLQLKKIGFVGTTSHGGVNNWKPKLAEFLAGARIVLCGDQDVPGLKYIEKVGRSLQGTAKDIRILQLPYEIAEDHGKDLTDYIQEFGVKSFKALKAAPWEPVELPEPKAKPTLASKDTEEPTCQREKHLALFEKAEGMQTIAITEYAPIAWTVQDILSPGYCTISAGSKLWKTASRIWLGVNFC